ncbi:O-antigen ligase family protein [Alcaligenaceae bacterium]|nr:O-antigen ligase family protein [Alcaligenaceae bacterium]
MLKLVLIVIYALIPLANLNSAKAPSALFYVALITALAMLSIQRFAGAGSISKRYWPLIVSYSILLLAVALSSLAYGHWAGTNGEGALRFFLGLWLLLLVLPQIDRKLLQQSVWGVYIAGLVSTVQVFQLTWPDFYRPDTPFHNAVTYGNLMLILSVISLFSIHWSLTSWPRTERIFKLLTSAIIFGGFMLTQTRSGWVAMPLFIFLGVILFSQSRHLGRIAAVTVIGLVIAVGIFSTSDALRDRTTLAYQEVTECRGEGSNNTTSVCIRLQLWRAAVDMLKQHPWVGIGNGSHFADVLKTDSYPKGLVSEFVVTEYFGEPHNDLLFALAAFGIPGGIGLLLIYLAPVCYFVKRTGRGLSPEIRAAAVMGIALCLGFAIFGITELMFRRMHVIGLYSMLVALFITLSDPKNSNSPLNNKAVF